jgi:hypothetical protein
MNGSKFNENQTTNSVKKFFRQGAIRISREKERAIYFYATVIFVLVYLFQRLNGGA